MSKMANTAWIKKMKGLRSLSGHTAWEAIARLEADEKRIAELEIALNDIIINERRCADTMAKMYKDFDASDEVVDGWKNMVSKTTKIAQKGLEASQ